MGDQSSVLEIRMLGAPQILVDGCMPEGLRARKAMALLFYLATELRTCAREEIAELLWGERSLDAARSLRVDLTKLNKSIGHWLVVRPNSLALRLGDDVRIDVQNYLQLSDDARHNPDALGEAIAGYHGDFLTGFDLAHPTPEFEVWIELWREKLRARHCDLLTHAAQHHMAHQRWLPALQCAQALYAILPLDPTANRLALLLLGLTSQPAMARRHLEQTELLASADPGALDLTALRELLAQIEAGRALSVVSMAQAAPQVALHWGAFQAGPVVRHFCPRPLLAAEIIQEMRDSSRNVILALVGAAGVGKTTLANALAHQLTARFPDGVLWGNAATTPPAALIDGWAQTLGFDFARLTDVGSKAAAWRSAIAHRRILVIIDDVIDPVGLGDLFPSTAGACVLLTSRNREAAVALNAREIAVGQFNAPTCRMLLEKILGSERVAAEADAADRLAIVVQGLPLALEILAKRLLYAPHDRIADLEERLLSTRHRLDLLRHGPQSVRASLALSWERLDTGLQHACAVASVFEGHPFTLEALTFLLQKDRYTVGDLLVGMLQRSLAFALDDGRYRQHTLVVEFASEQMEDRDGIERRMVDYYCGLARFRRNEISRLESEWPFLKRTLQWLATAQDDLRLLTLAEDLTPTWFGKGLYTEARGGLGLAVPAARRLALHEQCARLLNNRARACIEQADFDEALAHLEESFALAEMANMPSLGADSLLLRGRVEIERAEFDAARAHLGEARRIKAALGDEESVALSLYLEADIPYYAHDYARAQEMAMQAFAAFSRAENPIGRVQCLGLLADIAIARGNLNTAEEHCLSALQICDRSEERCERAVIHYSLSNVYLKGTFPDLSKALEHILASIALLQRLGDRTTLARALLRKSAIDLQMSAVEHARAAIVSAMEINRELDNRWGLVYDLRQLSAIALAERDARTAEAHLRAALAMSEAFPTHPLRAGLQGALDDLHNSFAATH